MFRYWMPLPFRFLLPAGSGFFPHQYLVAYGRGTLSIGFQVLIQRFQLLFLLRGKLVGLRSKELPPELCNQLLGFL